MSTAPRPTLPPSSGDDLGSPKRAPRDERPMPIPLAVGWTAGVALLFFWLLALIAALRPGASLDLISRFGCQAVAYLIGLFGVLQLHGPRASIREFVGLRPTSPWLYPIAVALGVALQAPLEAIYRAIDHRWPTPADDELVRLVAEGGPAQRLALCAILVVLGPVVEEVLFRGALLRPLRRAHGVTSVVLATAALFAVSHFQPQTFLPIGLFGVALGVLRVTSGSLLPAIVLHATYNAIPVASLLASGDDGSAARSAVAALLARLVGDAPLPAWAVALSSLVALGLIALAGVVGRRAEAALRAREKD